MNANYDLMLHDSHFHAANALITDDNVHDFEPPTIDGHKFCTGLIPRDYDKSPHCANAGEYPDDLLISEADLKDAFEQQQADHATLFDLRERSDHHLDSLDQDGLGLCWNFSTTKAVMYARRLAGLPMIALSPWWIAGRINSWRDQGGWGEASMAYSAKHGLPTLELCPKYDRKYDTPEVEKAALEHVTLEFWETSQDKDKRNHQRLSAYARGFCPVDDYNSIGHSMAGCRVPRYVSFHDYDVDDDNSWTMKSGNKGLYRMKGKQAWADGCVICRVSKATNN